MAIRFSLMKGQPGLRQSPYSPGASLLCSTGMRQRKRWFPSRRQTLQVCPKPQAARRQSPGLRVTARREWRARRSGLPSLPGSRSSGSASASTSPGSACRPQRWFVPFRTAGDTGASLQPPWPDLVIARRPNAAMPALAICVPAAGIPSPRRSRIPGSAEPSSTCWSCPNTIVSVDRG